MNRTKIITYYATHKTATHLTSALPDCAALVRLQLCTLGALGDMTVLLQTRRLLRHLPGFARRPPRRWPRRLAGRPPSLPRAWGAVVGACCWTRLAG